MKQKLMSGIIWRAAFIAAIFLLNLAFARHFGAQQSGSIFFITNNLSLLLLVCSLNLETGIGFYGAKANARQRLILLAYGLLATLLAILLFFIISNLPLMKPFIGLAEWPWYFPLFFITGNLLVTMAMALFFAKGSYLLPNVILTICTLVLAFYYFLLPSNGQMGSFGIKFFFWYHLLQGLFMLAAYLVTEDKKAIAIKEKGISLASLLKYSLVALINNFFLFLLYRLDFWLIEKWASTEELGNYIQVSKFGQLLLIAPAIFSGVVLPRIAGGQIKNYAKPAALAFLAIILFTSVALLVVFIGGSSLFEQLLGKDFNLMFGPGLLKIPAVLFLSLQFILGTWFSGTNKLRYNLYCTLLGLVIMLVTDILLIPTYGIYGASWGSLLAYLAAFLLSVYLYNRSTTQKTAEIWAFMKEVPGKWRNFSTIIRQLFGQ